MKELLEVSQVLTRYKLSKIKVLGQDKGQADRYNQFYNDLLEKRFTTDEAAAAHFFGGKASGANYIKFKNNFKRRLFNSLFFIDLKQAEFNDHQRAYYNCYKDWALVKILLGRTAVHAALELSKKILRQAIKYEFTDLVVDVTAILRRYTGTVFIDKPKYRKYRQLHREYLEIWQGELLAQEYYEDLIINYVNSRASQTQLAEAAQQFYLELEPLLKRFQAYKLHLFANLIAVIHCDATKDHHQMLAVCQRALAVFQEKPYRPKVALSIFQHQQLSCFIQIGRYKEGNIAALDCLNQLDEGTVNWFKTLELYIILSFHAGLYNQAYNLFLEGVGNKRFSYLSPYYKEIWTLFGAYLYFLRKTGQVDLEEVGEPKKQFKIGRFLNEVPHYSKDKRGMHIPILVIQVLILIVNKKYAETEKRIEALEKYCSRHLRKDDTFRSNCFIKMLIHIPKAGFHKTAVIRKVKKYQAKLKSMPIHKTHQAYGIELLPYEVAWELIVQSLDNKWH